MSTFWEDSGPFLAGEKCVSCSNTALAHRFNLKQAQHLAVVTYHKMPQKKRPTAVSIAPAVKLDRTPRCCPRKEPFACLDLHPGISGFLKYVFFWDNVCFHRTRTSWWASYSIAMDRSCRMQYSRVLAHWKFGCRRNLHVDELRGLVIAEIARQSVID